MLRELARLSVPLIFLMGADAQTNSYTVKNIVTSAQDSRLINPWGLARPGNPGLKENEWWVNDQGSGLSTLYDADGTNVTLAVKVPPARGIGSGSPTGAAFNPTNQSFAFATLDGTISVWNPLLVPAPRGPRCSLCHVSSATIIVNRAANGASFQGLAIATNGSSGASTYYAANANGGVEAYDAHSFSPVTLPPGAFTDPWIPASYTPAGIQVFGSTIFVTYNATAGGGTGYVDAYDTNGRLVLRLARGAFNQPWGVALSPANFGKFSGMILVGNTGSGLIGAYKLNGAFQGFLGDGIQALTIPGLWGLEFGNSNTQSGPTNVLYFTAGGPSQTTGVFGAISAN